MEYKIEDPSKLQLSTLSQNSKIYRDRSGALHKANYLSWHPTVGRNSTFVALTESQRQELGGVEYRSLKLLSKILVVYYIGFHLLALVFFLPFIFEKKNYRADINADGISPTWWAFFTAQTVFNDLGYTLTSDSMMQFKENAYILILSSFFIVIDQLKKERRPNRPPTKRQELLELRKDAEMKHFETGWKLPDLTDTKNVEIFRKWKGDTGGLNTITLVEIDRRLSINQF